MELRPFGRESVLEEDNSQKPSLPRRWLGFLVYYHDHYHNASIRSAWSWRAQWRAQCGWANVGQDLAHHRSTMFSKLSVALSFSLGTNLNRDVVSIHDVNQINPHFARLFHWWVETRIRPPTSQHQRSKTWYWHFWPSLQLRQLEDLKRDVPHHNLYYWRVPVYEQRRCVSLSRSKSRLSGWTCESIAV